MLVPASDLEAREDDTMLVAVLVEVLVAVLVETVMEMEMVMVMVVVEEEMLTVWWR